MDGNLALTKEEKKSLMNRYYKTEHRPLGHNPHIDQIMDGLHKLHTHTKKGLPKIRWRDDKIVTYKGDRHLGSVEGKFEKKETPEQIRATSVNLAWVRKKGTRNPTTGKSGKRSEGTDVQSWKSTRRI